MSHDLALCRGEFADDEFRESRLAVSVRADERDSAALFDGEGDVGEERRLGAGEAVLDVVEVNKVAESAQLFRTGHDDLGRRFVLLHFQVGASGGVVACAGG